MVEEQEEQEKQEEVQEEQEEREAATDQAAPSPRARSVPRAARPPIGAEVPDLPVPEPVVFLTGFLLVLVTNITNGTVKKLWDTVWNGKVSFTRSELAIIGGQLLFVMIASFLAKVSSDFSRLIFAFFVALWIVWAINNGDTIQRWNKKMLQNEQKGK